MDVPPGRRRPARRVARPGHRAKHRGRRTSTLSILVSSPSLARLLHYFAIRQSARAHLRELQRRLGLGSASLQRDLARLTGAGLLHRVREPGTRLITYSVAPHPAWEPVRDLIAASDGPADLLREALSDVSGVDAAFIFGSQASGDSGPSSDVDLLVVGDQVDTLALYRNCFEVGQMLGREVNTLRYSRAQLAARIAEGSLFVRAVVAGLRLWVAGDPDIIVPIAEAARTAARPTAAERVAE